MARPREYDDELRVRLIESAAGVLAAEGPGAVTTRRVAAEVGTSTSAIYTLIGSKDDLMRGICLEGFHRLADHLAAVPRTDDPLADLTGLGDAYFAMAIESPDLYRVMFGETRIPVALSDDESAFTQSTLQVVIDAVQRCIDAGAFTGDAGDIARELWALGHGVASLTNSGMLGSVEDGRRMMHAATTTMGLGLLTAAHAATPTGV